MNRDVLWVSRGEPRAVCACFMWSAVHMALHGAYVERLPEPGKEVAPRAF